MSNSYSGRSFHCGWSRFTGNESERCPSERKEPYIIPIISLPLSQVLKQVWGGLVLSRGLGLHTKKDPGSNIVVRYPCEVLTLVSLIRVKLSSFISSFFPSLHWIFVRSFIPFVRSFLSLLSSFFLHYFARIWPSRVFLATWARERNIFARL